MTLPLTSPPATRKIFLFILITVLLDMVGFGIIIPVLPKLIETVGTVDLATAAKIGGWMGAAYSIAQFAFGPLVGNLSDRFGRRPLLLVAVFGLGVDFLVQALAPTVGWLFVGRLLAGLCGASWVIANAVIADITAPEERGKYFGMMGAAFGVGFIIGPAIGGLLGEYGARVPFFAAACVSGLNLIFGALILPETLAPENRRPFDWKRANPLGAFRVFSRYDKVLPMSLVLGLVFFFTSIYPAIWPFWAKARFGWSEAMVGVTLALFGLIAAGFQGGLSGTFVKYLGERRTVTLGLVCSMVCLFGYGFVWSFGSVLVLMLIHGPEGFIHPMLTGVMSKDVPENAQGELQGGLSAVMNIAMLLGTVFYAQLFGWFMGGDAPFVSVNISYFVAATGMGLALVIYLWRIGHEDDERA